MTPSYASLLMSSFLLWINNKFINNSSGFYNVSSLLYPIKNSDGSNQIYQNYYNYGIPYSNQIVSDSSIAGANVISGLYLNNNFIVPGQSGFISFSYDKGQAIFNRQLPTNSTLSGNYAIKEFNIQLTSEPEEKLLFQTQYILNPKTQQIPTGAPLNSINYPCLMIKPSSSSNKPLAFGGENETESCIGVMVFADSQYSLNNAVSYLIDSYLEYVPFLKSNEFPYNNWGGLNSGQNFNYVNQYSTKVSNGSGILIKEAVSSKFDHSDIRNINPNVFFATVDFTLSAHRYPRYNPNGLNKS